MTSRTFSIDYAVPNTSAPYSADDAATFHGYMARVEDAMLLVEATNAGLCRRIKRRLQSKELASIRSGTIFVFDEVESNVNNACHSTTQQILTRTVTHRLKDGRIRCSGLLLVKWEASLYIDVCPSVLTSPEERCY